MVDITCVLQLSVSAYLSSMGLELVFVFAYTRELHIVCFLFFFCFKILQCTQRNKTIILEIRLIIKLKELQEHSADKISYKQLEASKRKIAS